MPVLRFHRAVLVGLATIVAEGGREAVGAVVLRRTAQRPESLLKVLGQRHETFPAQNHTDMLPTAVDHDEVVKQVRERLTCDRHLQFLGMGEVRLGHVSRLGRLAEDDVVFGSVQRPPLPHTPLKSAPDTIVRKRHRVQTLKVAQQGDGLQRAVILKQAEEIVFPVAFKGIGYRAPVNDLAVRGISRIDIKAARRPLTESGTGGRSALAVALEAGHV